MLNKGFRFIKEKRKSQQEESIIERVKLRRQKTYDKELFDTPPNSDDENNDEFIDIPDKSPLEDYEEKAKEEKGLEILTPNKLLSRPSILLAEIKAGSNSYKSKNEIRQILHLLYQHNKITKKVYNNLMKSLMEEDMVVIKDPKTFSFNFALPKRCWWEFETWNSVYHKKQWILSRDYNKKRDGTIIVKI